MKKILAILLTLTVFFGMTVFARPPAGPHGPNGQRGPHNPPSHHPAPPRHSPPPKHAPSPRHAPPPRHVPPRRNPILPPPGWYLDTHPHMKAWEEHERWDIYEERARLYVEFRDNNISKILGKQIADLDACREKLADAITYKNDFDIGFYQQKIRKIKDSLCKDYERYVIAYNGEVRLSQSEIEEIRRRRAENARQAEELKE